MPDTPRLIFASDHAGLALKRHLLEYAKTRGYAAEDIGTASDASCDYPDFGQQAAQAMQSNPAARAVLICGSGVGISIAANRYPHMRCALVRSAMEAGLARQHNDANAIALGERLTTPMVAEACLQIFLDTPFEGGRHQGRVEKLSQLPKQP